MTQYYIGCKQIEAWEAEKDGKPGYHVKYPDGYLSWSPKAVFEAAYLPMGTREIEPRDGFRQYTVNSDRVTQQMVDAFIGEVKTETRGKTTIVHATLANGFEIVESSSCVDPNNYSEAIGKECCMDRIKDRVWHLLGFLLQTARFGVKNK